MSVIDAPPALKRQGLVLALACVAQAMVGLDAAIVNVALPSIQRDLGVSEGGLQWIVVAYGLLLGGFLLVGGRMADQLGQRRMFLAGITVFTVASFAAGAAHHAGLLIAARAVQGFGAALLAPAALSLIAVTFADGRDRARALGLFGAVGGIAGSVGVVAGGLLAGGPGWRWSFFINVPAGLLVIVLAVAFLGRDRMNDRVARLDFTAANAVTGALLLFVYALHHTPALLLVAAGLFAVFVRAERRSATPLVPPALLRNRSLVAANATAFLACAGLLSFIFSGSLLMQQVLGFSPGRTGVAWLATTATVFPAAMAGSRLVGRVGVRPLLITGLSLLAAGTWWLSRDPGHAGYLTDLLPAFICAGLGFGLCGPALQIGALTGVSRTAAGVASGLVETMREIGGAAGVAAVSTVLVTGGFRAAFAVTGVLAVLGAIVAATITGRKS
jgi:EmrB/QacA subfamily drug resistance transporter